MRVDLRYLRARGHTVERSWMEGIRSLIQHSTDPADVRVVNQLSLELERERERKQSSLLLTITASSSPWQHYCSSSHVISSSVEAVNQTNKQPTAT
jgi:hypothetical protein